MTDLDFTEKPAILTGVCWLFKCVWKFESKLVVQELDQFILSPLNPSFCTTAPSYHISGRKSPTRVKCDHEDLFCTVFISLMNPSLSCGHCRLTWTLLRSRAEHVAGRAANGALVAQSSEGNLMKRCFPLMLDWKCTMRCLHCKRAKSLQIWPGLPFAA